MLTEKAMLKRVSESMGNGALLDEAVTLTIVARRLRMHRSNVKSRVERYGIPYFLGPGRTHPEIWLTMDALKQLDATLIRQPRTQGVVVKPPHNGSRQQVIDSTDD